MPHKIRVSFLARCVDGEVTANKTMSVCDMPRVGESLVMDVAHVGILAIAAVQHYEIPIDECLSGVSPSIVDFREPVDPHAMDEIHEILTTQGWTCKSDPYED